jgi:hypothetical protein
MNKLACSLALLSLVTLRAPRVHADAVADIGERMIKIFERMAADIDANKPDCDKIGAALNKHVDDDVAAFAEAKKVDAGMTVAQRKAAKEAMDKKYGARAAAAKKKMAPLKACSANPSVKAYADKVGL